MAKLLYVQASPQGERSRSIQVAEAFLHAYRSAHPSDEVLRLNVFQRDLPAFDGAVLAAKYAILHGQQPSEPQRAAWRAVERLIDEFTSADKYLFAVPMWNFGIPYRLKQYIDALVQPGYTFAYDPASGYRGLVTGKPALAIYARGGKYGEPQAAGLDHQKPYLEMILGFIGFAAVRSIVVEPTLAEGPELAERKVKAAIAQAGELAASW